MKGPSEKNFEGIYSNSRFVHAAASCIGCVVQIQVKNGSVFEGVFRTFSQKLDIVLEMAHRIEEIKMSTNNVGLAVDTMISSILTPEDITDKLIFKVEDIITISVSSADPDFATRESFTDTAISKFNGQVQEKELEPWDGGDLTTDSVGSLSTEGEASNGWDPNDMFKTNEEKYGVKSSFDSNLSGYTIALEKRNTEEYKQQEAKASKIAEAIESGFHHKAREELENGDEEERFSAVVRGDSIGKTLEPRNAEECIQPEVKASKLTQEIEPGNYLKSRNALENGVEKRFNSNFRANGSSPRFPPRRKNNQNMRSIRSSPSPSVHPGNRNANNSQQHHNRVSSPATSATASGYKTASPASSVSCVSTPSPRPTPSSTPTPRQNPNNHHVHGSLQQHSQGQLPQHMTTSSAHNATPLCQNQDSEDHKINGEIEKMEPKYEPKPPRTCNQTANINKEIIGNFQTNQHSSTAHKNMERKKEGEKKGMIQKARDDKTEGLKRFHSTFKLSEDKDSKELKEESQKSDISNISNSNTSAVPKQVSKEKERPKEEEKSAATTEAMVEAPDAVKGSTLNPNAKEFVLNPNAKTFTPRAPPVANNVVPPSVQPPPRLQSPVMAVPQPHLMSGIAQPIFTNMAPQYIVSATPVSVPMGSPFTPQATMVQASRYRKAMPMTLQQRHEMSQSVHVQAATGQPILAPPLSTPQFAIQYTPSPGMLHHQGPPQPTIGYTQMYSVMGPPRVINPSAVGIVPTSSYGENQHIPTHLYMTHPGNPNMSHAVPPGSSGQHSNPSTPQSQTPSLHPAPSPVHQPPSGPHNNHGQQQQAPGGHPSNAPTPQPVIYHGHIASQHPVHANPVSSNQTHPYPTFSGTPQPVMLVPQQAVSGPHAPHPASFASTLQSHHLHGQTPGSHAGTPTHVLPHPSMAMIQTSAAMVHSQTMSSGHFAPQSQVP